MLYIVMHGFPRLQANIKKAEVAKGVKDTTRRQEF